MGHFKLKILYSLLCTLGITGMLAGQNSGAIQKVKAVEPFLNEQSVQIQQDFEENLWITTPVKVTKYNSAELNVYNKFKGIPKEVGQELLGTYTDSRHQVWLYGSAGIAIFRPSENSFHFIGNTTGRIYKVFEDAGEQLWIAAENGVFKLSVNSDKEDFGLSRFLSENTMAADIVAIGNEIVFAGPNGILTINRRSGKFNKKDLGYFQNMQITSVLALDDKILLGTDGKGLYQSGLDFRNIQKVYTLPYEASRRKITKLHRFEKDILVCTNGTGVIRLNENLQPLPETADYPEKIYTSYLSDKNLLWMISREGLFIQNISGLAIERLTHDPTKYSSISDDFITAAARDAEGNIWFGTGNGLSIWSPRTDRWRHIENLNFNRNLNEPDHINGLVALNEHMWVATANDGVYKINITTLLRAHYSIDSKNKTPIQNANTIFADAAENIWIGGEDGYLTMIKPTGQIKTFPIKEVQAVAELGPKKIIIANNARFYSLNPASGRITDLEKLTANEEMMFYSVNDLQITQNGTGLIATEGAGFLIYDFENEKIEVINDHKGLPSNNAVSIEAVSNDEFWIATDDGLAYLQKESGEMKVYSQINGLTTNKLTTSFVKLSNGDYALGSTRGVNVFKPRSLLAQHDFKPVLKLKSVRFPSEDEQLSAAKLDTVRVDGSEKFQVKFSAISHLNPEDIRFSWKLDGVDDEWSAPTSLNTANFSGLEPGNYTFLVRSRLGDGGWTTPISLPVTVKDTGDALNMVYLFMGIGVVSMLIIFAVVFIKRSRRADAMAKAELRSRLQKEFKAPVETAVHSLSKISSANDPDSQEDLKRYAARFENLFQQILNFNYQESVFEIAKINVHKHMEKLVTDLKPLFREKELEVSINDQWGDGPFYFSRENLDKICFSLISASSYYSVKKGKILINLIETSVGDLKFQITDNGSGMPPRHMKDLDKRVQPKSRKFRDRTGLNNLMEARKMIEKTGGSFSYESIKNEGSTFTAVLKTRKDEYQPLMDMPVKKAKVVSASPFPKEITQFSESKILIIENDEDIRTDLTNAIGKYCQIYQASTAEEGIEKAGMIFPDIIVTATVLPDMNAFQLTKMLKNNIGLNHINIFLVADQDQMLVKEQMEEMTEVVRKPIDMNQLLAKIAHILGWQQRLRNEYVRSLVNDEPATFRSESDEKFIHNLADIVILNLKKEDFSVHDLSHKIGMDSNSLFMKLKNLVNLSPQDFIEFTRVNHAKQMLAKGEINVMEVSYKSGFTSPKEFYSSFKKYYGYTPSGSVEKNMT